MDSTLDRFVKRHFILITLISSVLTAIAFPPCGLLGFVWFSLVPWLYLLPLLTLRQLLISHILFTSCFFLIGVSWMSKVHPICPFAILLPLYIICLPFPLLFHWSTKYTKVPIFFLAPIFWTANEYLRSFLFSGFPWLYLGHTQAFYPKIIQIADITGVYGVTFLIVLVNSLFLSWIQWYIHKTKILPQISYTLTTLGLLITALIYGTFSLQNISYKLGPKIAAIQGNIPQDIKDKPDENRTRILHAYTSLTLKAVKQHPDLLVWPETMSLDDPQLELATWEMFKDIAQHSQSYLLIGAHHYSLDFKTQNYHAYNSVYFFHPTGQILGRYDKVRLVMIGEYVPLRSIFPFLPTLIQHIAGYVPNLYAGTQRNLFTFKNYRFGTLICYEIVYAEDARELRKKGSQFIINLTNEGWFAHTSEYEQILQSAIFRAVENRIGILRASNTGITLAIPPNGCIYRKNLLAIPIKKYLKSLPMFMQKRIQGKKTIAWHHIFSRGPWIVKLEEDWDIGMGKENLKWKDFPGIFCQQVPLACENMTFYTRFGDLFVWLITAIAIMIGGSAFLSWRKSTS